jgi:hypothetical protein
MDPKATWTFPELFRLANQALVSVGYKVWVLLDRLDVAF